ncbi:MULTISPECIES: DUF1573 domain-containing protein [Mesonia]|uniref:Uncharacterized protein n=1 Tax=Mesonia oceanica TaxID=2687242 RepID=A0AC61YA18_9FLAO|nr:MULTISPECIES: DUF1573 domain-containing protein [Mesonia]MAN26688.1 hypothetical protein [Mesonia sp.]MAQ39806.1 hypothetical protein [Mesonia sp.]MBJ96664.1 hypothetical protein [Flavobacteriaceae bacterium]VVV01361.1 hypothetical protein FVB9532_02651 [Mesonia oceanica]|tara:strand:- start:1599 stop:2069 length:471 start_codon:yes stop_codon:yes gene_type:complete
MKKVVLMLAAVATVGFTSCKEEKASDKVKEEKVEEVAERDANAEGTPEMKFEEEMYDFGTINEGDVVEHTFKFTNTGDSPLVISNAKGSCGCTVPSWPKEPVAAGETGEMTVKFNSRNKPNNQMKTVRITTNTESGQEMIKIKAFVTPKDGGEAKS